MHFGSKMLELVGGRYVNQYFYWKVKVANEE